MLRQGPRRHFRREGLDDSKSSTAFARGFDPDGKLQGGRMTRDGDNAALSPDSSFVVTYQGTDPFFHRRGPDRANRPACESRQRSGVLTPLVRAQDAGLMPCPRCWTEDTDGH